MLQDILTTSEDTMAKAPTLDLEAMSGKQLEELIQKAAALKEERKAETIQSLRVKIQAMMEDEGLSLTEVFPPAQPTPARGRPRSTDGTRAPAKDKYKFPDGSSWTGKGRLSNVARQYLVQDGVDLEDKEAMRDGLSKYLIP